MTQWRTTLVLLLAVLGGVALGSQLFAPESAGAQRRGFTQCFFAHQESVDVNDVHWTLAGVDLVGVYDPERRAWKWGTRAWSWPRVGAGSG